MKEDDPLHSVLREWPAPEPSAPLEARIWRAARPPVWQRIWTARISLPVPVFAAGLLVLAALIIQLRPTPPAPTARKEVTTMTPSGFVPLPNGAARVVPVKDVEQ